jgi:hypothetical protein
MCCELVTISSRLNIQSDADQAGGIVSGATSKAVAQVGPSQPEFHPTKLQEPVNSERITSPHGCVNLAQVGEGYSTMDAAIEVRGISTGPIGCGPYPSRTTTRSREGTT